MKKIKTAEEYLKDVNSLTLREDLYKIGKQMQLEMLEHAVNKCAENAEINYDSSSKWQCVECGADGVSKQSILKTIDEIKKELDESKL